MSWTLLSPFVMSLALASPNDAMQQCLAEQGPRALANPQVAAALELTSSQQEELQAIMEDQQLAQAELLLSAAADEQEHSAELRQVERTVLRWKAEYQLLAVLTPQQLRQTAGAIGNYHLDQLRNSGPQDGMLFHDPLRMERMRHLA